MPGSGEVMKKGLCLVMAAALVLAVTSCAQNDDGGSSSNSVAEVSVSSLAKSGATSNIKGKEDVETVLGPLVSSSSENEDAGLEAFETQLKTLITSVTGGTTQVSNVVSRSATVSSFVTDLEKYYKEIMGYTDDSGTAVPGVYSKFVSGWITPSTSTGYTDYSDSYTINNGWGTIDASDSITGISLYIPKVYTKVTASGSKDGLLSGTVNTDFAASAGVDMDSFLAAYDKDAGNAAGTTTSSLKDLAITVSFTGSTAINNCDVTKAMALLADDDDDDDDSTTTSSTTTSSTTSSTDDVYYLDGTYDGSLVLSIGATVCNADKLGGRIVAVFTFSGSGAVKDLEKWLIEFKAASNSSETAAVYDDSVLTAKGVITAYDDNGNVTFTYVTTDISEICQIFCS